MAFSFEPDIDAIIVAAAERHGLDPNAMRAIAQIESRGDPSAQNPRSSAGGLFQQIDSNAREFGVTDRFDPAQSAEGAAAFGAQNAARLRNVLGREPTVGELYLAHQQGGGGASKLLRDPNARAADIVGADAVRLNGGDLNMSAGEFANIWMQKADRLAGTATAPAPAASAPQAATAPQQPVAPAQTHGDRFAAALARVQAPEMTTQDRLASVGASLMSLDQGGPILPMQGRAGKIDLSNMLDKARELPIFNRQKGLSL